MRQRDKLLLLLVGYWWWTSSKGKSVSGLSGVTDHRKSATPFIPPAWQQSAAHQSSFDPSQQQGPIATRSGSGGRGAQAMTPYVRSSTRAQVDESAHEWVEDDQGGHVERKLADTDDGTQQMQPSASYAQPGGPYGGVAWGGSAQGWDPYSWYDDDEGY